MALPWKCWAKWITFISEVANSKQRVKIRQAGWSQTRGCPGHTCWYKQSRGICFHHPKEISQDLESMQDAIELRPHKTRLLLELYSQWYSSLGKRNRRTPQRPAEEGDTKEKLPSLARTLPGGKKGVQEFITADLSSMVWALRGTLPAWLWKPRLKGVPSCLHFLKPFRTKDKHLSEGKMVKKIVFAIYVSFCRWK